MTTITISKNNTSVDEGVVNGTTVDITGNSDTVEIGGTGDAITAGNSATITDAGQATPLTNSTITAGNGGATITATGADDQITVGNGTNNITAGPSATILIGSGQNTVTAGANSTISPNGHDDGKDTVTAGPGSTITLGNGGDMVFAGANSTITIGNGQGTVRAGTTDAITVGSGLVTILYDGLTPAFTVPASLTVFEDHPAVYPTASIADTAVSTVALPITVGPPSLGNEVITGFRPQQDEIELDTLDFPNYAAVQAASKQVGSDVVITQPSGGGTITLKNVSLSKLSASNFTFFGNDASDQITISGVPGESTLSAGTPDGGGTWTLTYAQLPGLQLIAGEPTTTNTPAVLTVTVANPAGQGASSSQNIPLTINPVVPNVDVGVTGNVKAETELAVSSEVDDADLSIGNNDWINRIQLSGVPSGVTLTSPGNTVTGGPGPGTFTISTSGNPATFNPAVDVSAPGGTYFTLGITAYSDELSYTGGPTPEQASSTTQVIDIPTANPYSAPTLEDNSITIPISDFASDLNPGANLQITSVGAPENLDGTGVDGTLSIGPGGQSVTYNPAGGTPLDYEANGKLTGDGVTFSYTVTNALGGTNSNTITVTETPVADTPTVSDSVLLARSGDPATLTRLDVTATTPDYGTVNQGSDYIQSLQFSGVPTGVTLSDPDGGTFTNGGDGNWSLTGLSNQGFLQSEVDVSAPAGVNINFNLGITAVNAETEGFGSPATAISSQFSQNIEVDNSTATANPDFTTSGQSIWSSGNAFNFDYHQFLGISNGSDGYQNGTSSGLKTFKGHIGGFGGSSIDLTTGATVGGTIGLKAGFQVDLSITGGSWNASLPFNVTLDDTYNKTTGTLEVAATDSASDGTFGSIGPGGSFDLKAILDAFLAAGGQFCLVGVCGGTHFSTGTIGGTKTLLNVNTSKPSTVHKSFALGSNVTLNLTYPQVNTNGNGAATNITAANMAQGLGLSVDALGLILQAILGKDPLKGSLGIGTYDIASALLKAGLDLKQSFDLSDAGISADLLVGTSQTDVGPLNFGGTPTVVQNVASDGLNSDGSVPLALKLTLNNPQLLNNTSLVPTAGASLTLGKVNLSLLGTHIGGTLFKTGITVPLGSFKVYGTSFPAAFASQTATGLKAT